ncbi:MAG: hypothetical protein AAGU11_20505, partial [Syntrophobacteraceae bacterium]
EPLSSRRVYSARHIGVAFFGGQVCAEATAREQGKNPPRGGPATAAAIGAIDSGSQKDKTGIPTYPPECPCIIQPLDGAICRKPRAPKSHVPVLSA